jgi:thiamine biosynthesis lipoprotein
MKPTFSSSRRALLVAGAGSAALLAAGYAGRHRLLGGTEGQHAFHGLTMGSSYTVKLHAPRASEAALAAARGAVAAALDGVVARMSTYDPASELSRFNRHASGSAFALSDDTMRVFEIAQRVSAASGGAFDVTVAPVVDLWGFGPDKRAPDKRSQVPREADLRRAREAVDWRALTLDAGAGTISKARPRIAADLSGVAKGYGADLAARALDALGFERYLVEVGGEIRTRGTGAEGRPWRVAVERPDAMPRRAHFVVPLAGQSMATSGDYRIYFEHAGQRYCHEMDPAAGAPVRHRLASVSVVAGDCADADAWSTALFVLGAERGYSLACARGLAAHFIERGAGGRFEERHTPAFAALGGDRA